MVFRHKLLKVAISFNCSTNKAIKIMKLRQVFNVYRYRRSVDNKRAMFPKSYNLKLGEARDPCKPRPGWRPHSHFGLR